MPYVKKDGTVNYPRHMIVDDLTFRTDISRQRKYQIRKRRQHQCMCCGAPLELKNKIRKETIVVDTDEHCPKCRDNKLRLRRGFLQGRKERIEPVDTNVEGFVD